MNENFYRTTFFELCSRFLSRWFTWNVERSYPKGKTDLEFVGKFHEKFAGVRMVIRFKYFSNAQFANQYREMFFNALREMKEKNQELSQRKMVILGSIAASLVLFIIFLIIPILIKIEENSASTAAQLEHLFQKFPSA
ncbi:MAG: PD-(D/E)XK nuclease domain-containing protein [Desulfobacterales bacterium]